MVSEAGRTPKNTGHDFSLVLQLSNTLYILLSKYKLVTMLHKGTKYVPDSVPDNLLLLGKSGVIKMLHVRLRKCNKILILMVNLE